MLGFLLLFLRCLFSAFQSHSGLVLENLALRHQLAVLKRQACKPKLLSSDRLLWVGLRRIWPHDCPLSGPVEPPDQGDIIALPWLGGLHHRYTRQAA